MATKLNIFGLYDPKWFDFKEGSRLQIRQLPASADQVTVERGGIVVRGSENWSKFDHCLTGAENFTDAEGNPIDIMKPDVKKAVFDFNVSGIAVFVMQTVQEMAAAEAADQKD